MFLKTGGYKTGEELSLHRHPGGSAKAEGELLAQTGEELSNRSFGGKLQ